MRNCIICNLPTSNYIGEECYEVFNKQVDQDAKEMGFNSMKEIEDNLGPNAIYYLLKGAIGGFKPLNQ